MAVSLAEGKNNATDDLDVMVIDEFRKESVLIDALMFDDVVNPAGGGDTLTYGYRRLATQATASTRAINNEYVAQNVTTTKHTVDLAVLGGSFQVDRVVAKIGPAASGAVTLNMQQKIKATVTEFQDLVINGDTGVDANAFDGLDVALSGSSTEFRADQITDWTDLDTSAATKFTALDALDEFLMLLDGEPSLLMGNMYAIAKVRAIVRRTGMYTRDPIEGLAGQNGRPVIRETYGNLTFVDLGAKSGSNAPIVALRDPDSTSFTITRGAKLMKPAPRSGSITMMRAMRSCESPSSSMSPIARLSDSSSGASTHTSPRAGMSRVGWSSAPGASATLRLPRSG